LRNTLCPNSDVIQKEEVRKKTRFTPKFVTFALERDKSINRFSTYVRKNTRFTPNFETFALKRDKGIIRFSTTCFFSYIKGDLGLNL